MSSAALVIAFAHCLLFAGAFRLDDAKIDGNATENDALVIIDQRQNGTENYRIKIDGVVISIASLDTLLSQTLSDFDFFEDDEDLDLSKPSEQNSTAVESVSTSSDVANLTVTTNAPTKTKRRRLAVPALMRSILKKTRATEA